MTKQQQRARARRRHLRQQAALARKADERERARRLGVVAGVVVALVLVLAGLGAALSRTEPVTPTTATGCEAPPAILGTAARLELPDPATAAGRTVEATVTTNCGDIVLELDGEHAPQAVASFVQLARTDYWAAAPCHRVLRTGSGALLQCGDPTGTGQGSPGYGFGVENPATDGVYRRGTVAMARTSDAEQGNGGQFFIVTSDITLPDPNGYTVFGQVTQGLGIVDRIVAEGVAGGDSATDGAPAAPISILRVAVTEKKA